MVFYLFYPEGGKRGDKYDLRSVQFFPWIPAKKVHNKNYRIKELK